MIAIKSNKELNFNPVTRFSGFITVRVSLYQRDVINSKYILKLEHICEKEINTGEVDEDGKTIMKTLQERNFLLRDFEDSDINTLASISNIDLNDKSKLTENLDEIFRIGLLAKTQQDCDNGEGLYFSNKEDWAILK